MKTLCPILVFILSLTLVSSSCKKHVIKPADQLSLLPPATQTGANTFGCLVNGAAFLPAGGDFSGPIKQCSYIYTSGGFHFTVAASNKDNNNLIKSIIVGTDSLAIAEGKSFTFKTFISGNADASYLLVTGAGDVNQYITNNTVSGILLITKMDTLKQFVSGTFWFNAVNGTGDVVKVTDGRFDMPYTR